MADIFQNKTKTIPKSDNRVVRVPFDHSEIGARKSHISGIAPKNENVIRHTK